MKRLTITSTPGATEGQRWREIEAEAERRGYRIRAEFDELHPGGLMVSTWRNAGDRLRIESRPAVTLLASSATREDLLKQVQGYFYSSGVFFVENEVHNSTGRLKSFQISERKGRWRFERID